MDAPFSSLFELLPIGAYRTSLDGRQLRANAALVRLNGYASEAEMLAAVADIAAEWYVDPQRRRRFLQIIERDGQVVDFVSEVYRHKTRERIWVRETAHLVRADDGSVAYFEGTVEDITGPRSTLLALQASERRFRALTEKAQELILVCDTGGRVTYASPAALQLLGVLPDEMTQRSVFDWVQSDELELVRTELESVITGRNSAQETIVRVQHADGSQRYLAALANNCLGDPAVNGIVLNLRDVTERQQADNALRLLNAELEARVRARTGELERARDDAEAANRAKSEFLSRMSHELRTPLNAILGFAQLLAADPALPLAPRQSGQVGQILHAGAHLLELINEVLDLARIEAGRLPISVETVDAGALCDECLALLQPLAREEGIQLAERSIRAADCFVSADRIRLRQVLLNLISNAIKYNRRGGRVEVGCAIEDDSQHVRIGVGDTGLGLDASQRARLFQTFERLDAPGRAIEGAGLGLALSKRLVEAMHGEIGLDSEVGVGSRFWLRLARAEPVVAPAAVEPAAIQPAAVATGATGVAGVISDGAAPRTVLYIEDNPVNLLLMEGLLAQMPAVRLLSAARPDTGLALARSERPQLILLDIQLPGIDGYEVLRRLRDDPLTRATPVIAVSANAMRTDLERGQAAGFDDYLTKPLDLRRLLAAVERALSPRPAAAP